MKTRLLRLAAPVAVLIAVAGGAAAGSTPRAELTLEARVDARLAVERVYHRHRLDAPPFAAAVPRAVVAATVADTLRLTRLLAERWGVVVTPAMLDAELRRMAAGTRAPDRLREIYDALHRDPLLVREVLARPALVRRLAAVRFDADVEIHAESRGRAGALAAALRRGEPGPVTGRTIRYRSAGASLPAAGDDAVEIGRSEWAGFRARLAAGPVVESRRDAFVVLAPAEIADEHAVVTSWSVPRPTWDAFWADAAPGIDVVADTIAADHGDLPEPLGVLGGTIGECAPLGAWSDVAVAVTEPAARSGHTAVWTGSEMIVWGGVGPRGDGGVYDPAIDAWRAVTTVDAPSARTAHTAVWADGTMIVWGGFSDQALANGGRYDPIADSWTAVATTDAPGPRRDHTAVWTGTEMIVFGGRTAAGSVGLGDGGRYDPATDTWGDPPDPGTGPVGRFQHDAVWTGTEMIVWGGAFGVGFADGTGARFDPVAEEWTPITITDAPVPRLAATVVWADDRMLVWGGIVGNGDPVDSGGSYDPATDAWSPLATTDAPTPRSAHVAVWTGAAMVVWGGAPLTDSGGRYDPVADTWIPTSSVAAPSGRRDATVVWTGDEMIVWGGLDPARAASGGRYDPVADTWIATAASPVPDARTRHTAVWTGAEMIVWGGNAVGPLGTGGRWDPVTDTWLATTSLAAPAPRERHAAVWTGSRMVVWGGQPLTDTGARYDPVADAWTATSELDAPTPRWGHAAVWSGSEMIVWGGFDGTPAATGGRYDPLADSWVATSETGAPAGRWEYPAVWSGSELIVWGGAPLNGAGARYDPALDAWTDLPTADAPTPRQQHAAVWAGDAMIVWGGRDQFPIGDGAIYDRAADAWIAVPAAGGPTARYDHTAVWSGSEMIVWGGFTGETHVADGASYEPTGGAWTVLPASGAPAARARHTAVWTGDAMVVWGGGGAALFGTGGSFGVDATPDADGDGFPCDAECDDSDPATFPGAAEVCDGADNDCNGIVDDGFDADGDGFSPCGLDCDDGDEAINPGAAEVCDGLDNDCSGAADDGTPDADADRVRDDCDNCPAERNVAQADRDDDGEGDACDLDDGQIELRVDGVEVRWQAEAGFNAFNLYRGDLTVLRAGGAYTQDPQVAALAEQRCDLAATIETDDLALAPGDGVFYLVAGVAAGTEGGLGADGAGQPRPNANPCP